MKNKIPLQMIEFLIMLLVFAILSALCLGIFSHANDISRETEMRDLAIVEAQNAAELISYHKGEIDSAGLENLTKLSDTNWQINHAGFTLTVTLCESDSLLGEGIITAVAENGDILAEVPVSWQKEGAR